MTIIERARKLVSACERRDYIAYAELAHSHPVTTAKAVIAAHDAITQALHSPAMMGAEDIETLHRGLAALEQTIGD